LRIEGKVGVELFMLGELVGAGRTAEIFAIDDATVLKLWRPGWGAEDADEEIAVAERIAATGVPAPRCLGRRDEAGRAGIIYERINGPSLEKWLGFRLTRVPATARILAATHARVHQGQGHDLPGYKEVLERRIQRATRAPTALRTAASQQLATLPDGTALCHGDYHMGNVLLGQQGPVVIDWENAAIGDPLADIARTRLVLQMSFAHVPPSLRGVVWAATHLLAWLYLAGYRRAAPIDRARLAAWDLPITVARLCEGIAEEEPHLLRRATLLARG
jgi:aminoglycoside phosphotransferase (APT) family kinase protein